jgi:hypothetical protein
MQSHTITVTPPSGNNGTGWVDVDVSATPLAGVQPGTPVVINPVSKSINITSLGLAMAFVSAPDVISFGVKLLTAPVDLLVSIP